MDSENISGQEVLLGLAGHTICNNLNNESLRALSECSKQMNSLSIGSIRALAPKKLPIVGSLAQRFAHLQVLDLSRDQCRLNIAASLREVPTLKHIRHLRLQRCLSLTDEALAELATYCQDNSPSSLTSIDFRGCTKLTWSGLGHLSSLTNLRHLNCSGIKYVEDGASGDKATAVPLHHLLGQLSRLTMGDACTLSWVDDRLMAVVGAHASRLTTLDCSGCIDMSDAGALAVCNLRQLEELSLQSCVRLTNKCFESLQHLTNLKSLNVRGCLQLTNEGLIMISKLTKLESLDLTCCPAIQSLEAALLSHLVSLKDLNVSSCSSLTNLDNLLLLSKTLQHLSIASCSNLPMESLTSLSSLTGLISLDMSGLRNRGTLAEDVDERLSRLSCLTNLQALHVSRFTHPQGLPRGLLHGLAGMVSLKELHMVNCSRERTSSPMIGVQIIGGSNKTMTGGEISRASESQLWFLENLVQLQHLDLSGWRHAKASSLMSLSGLKQLTHLKMHRFGNDTGSGSSQEVSSEVHRVHEKLKPVRCPSPVASSSDSDLDPSDGSLPGNSTGRSEASWLMDQGQSIEVDSLRERIARFSFGFSDSDGGDSGSSDPLSSSDDGGDRTNRNQQHRHSLYTSATSRWSAINQKQSMPLTTKTGCDTISTCDSATKPDQGLHSLMHLGGLTKLVALDLEACVTLTDGSIQSLSGLIHLERLNLSGCIKLRGSTLGHLPKSLEELNLDDCPKIGAAALAHVAELSSLRSLSLRGCAQVDDAGLQAIASGLRRLISLSLFSSSGVTAKGLASLSRLPLLKTLHLSHCWNVDDEGLMQLARCKSLVMLNLQHCWKVSEAALMAMQQTSPVLEILMG